MRKLNGLLYVVCTLAMSITTANAQMTITIDNQVIPTEHIASIVILPNTNEINVATNVAYNINPVDSGSNVVINSFNVSAINVTVGQSLIFNWDISNAVSCAATGGVDGWAGSQISLPSGNRSITTATTGSYTYTLTCNGNAEGDTATRSIVVNTTAANAVSITSFTATPDAISAGSNTTLSWTTVNAVSCTPTGGTSTWQSTVISRPNGSAVIAINTAGTYTFTLVCQGASNDQQMKSKVVVVTAAPQSCDSVSLSGKTVSWDSFWVASFPLPTYENVTNYIIAQKGFLAIEFNTGSIIDDGKISALENASTPGIRLGSISQCPGNFNVAQECQYSWGLGGGVRWATNGKLGACNLQSNKTYYFNITFTNGVDPDSTSCNATPCRINLQHVNL